MMTIQEPLAPELAVDPKQPRCDECNANMPEGQTGCCDEYGRTEFSFDELSDRAKQTAREQYTSDDYPGHVWWDGVYDGANEAAQLLGIDISMVKGHGLSIWFRGFHSQGDGASFDGSYSFEPKAVENVKMHYPCDTALLHIAERLTLMQVTQRLAGRDFFAGAINSSHRGYSIETTILDWGSELEDGSESVGEPDENEFQRLMQDFADWIYAQLREEDEYLHSDEYVDEELRESEKKFDEDGNEV